MEETRYFKERNIIRRYIDGIYDKLKKGEEVEILKQTILGKQERLDKLDETIHFFMAAKENITDENWNEELEAAEEYRDKCAYILVDHIKENKYSSTNTEELDKKKYKLPKLEYTKFDGLAKNWLPFWGQFRKIADDKKIDEEDKFQYLLQVTTGKARTLVESFPASGNNFAKVLCSLKDRFARNEVIVEHYVRELLNIMLKQVTSKHKIGVGELYDSISRQINALETLNMTRDSYAAMLLPMIESALPSHILIEWERSKNKISGSDKENQNFSLDKLMDFLRREVESEERVKFAQQSLENLGINNREVESKSEGNFPTAANLINQNLKNKPGLDKCIFCCKQHLSQECYKGVYMTLNDKKDLIVKNKLCFSCFKKSHTARECRFPPRCFVCRKNHYVIMCPELSCHKSKQREGQHKKGESSKKDTGEKVVQVNSNLNEVAEVYMQTLILNIGNPRDKNRIRKVRVLLDSGSQKSYILTRLARELSLPEVGQCTMVHSLFGGVEKKQKHCQHKIILEGANKNDYKFETTVFTQDKICNIVSRVEDLTVLDKLREKNIILSDNKEEKVNEISLLLGADVIGLLLTGKMVKVGNITCMDTWFGWTAMGSSSMLNITSGPMCLQNLSQLTNLWELEAIGISDPGRVISKKERETEVLENFHKTLRVNDESRYEVRLPWVSESIQLGDNREVAEKRLINVTNRLVKLEKLDDYDKEFKYWLDQGIIERVDSKEEEKGLHYLPELLLPLPAIENSKPNTPQTIIP